MLHSEPCNEVVAALVAVHVELHDPGKTRKVDAGQKKYSYAELDKCLPDIRALLASKGMLVTQSLMAPDIMVTTLFHVSGQWIRSECPVTMPVKAGDPQAFGSSITYARRYSLFMALGLVAQNEDNDGKLPDSRDRKREAPDAKKARQDQHHASWAAEQGRFMGDLKKAGFPDYDEVCQFMAAQAEAASPPRPFKKPSELSSRGREAVLARLKDADVQVLYSKWLEEHVAKSVADGGGV